MGTLGAFWQVLDCGFVNYDDITYVGSPHVQSGLTVDNIKWAFKAIHCGNWHPLTSISHMLDCQIYGLNPRWHHLTNLLLHIANTVLLFLVLVRMTGLPWRSAFVAGLFAVHPLHVESVAWVAERKDVLSTFFWMLTMYAYVRYVEHPRLTSYAPVLVFLALGLMAKPMLVTLPFVLLLLDYWPLGRFASGKKQAWPGWRLILEKAPLYMLAAASSVVTYLVQQKGGAMISFAQASFSARAANAVLSYGKYLWKTIWPTGLAVFYPYPADPAAAWKVGGTALVLVCISALVIFAARRRPYLATGWLWYLGTLVPVIGLVQVGEQAMADRYTYIPLIGLFIMVAWDVPELSWRNAAGRIPVEWSLRASSSPHWRSAPGYRQATGGTTSRFSAMRFRLQRATTSHTICSEPPSLSSASTRRPSSIIPRR